MNEINKKLDEPIPREVISSRDAAGGKQLSYLESWYVIDRLNQVLGNLNWSNEILDLTLLTGTDFPAYRATVRLLVVTLEGRVIAKDGIGFGSDKFKSKTPHELAMKEAVSDALKVAAKNLGRSLGLALYDKTQEFVTDVKTTSDSTTSSVATGTNSPTATDTTTKKSKKDPRSTIRSAFQVLQAQKKVTKETFAKEYLFGKASKDLTDSEAETALGNIKTNFKELGL